MYKNQRYWWWEEYHCGCVKEYPFRRECLDYCPKHGENTINLYRIPLETGATEDDQGEVSETEARLPRRVKSK